MDEKKYADYLDDVFRFLLKCLSSENLLAVSAFLERCFQFDPVKYKEVQTLYEEEAKKIEEGVYDVSLPRDVFVAYKSEDREKMLALVDHLEQNGLTCFVALRNLQHGKDAPRLYDEKLEKAMDSCRVVVFVSSRISRTKGDARNKELMYVRQKDFERGPSEYKTRNDYVNLPRKYKKPRVEYVIEPYMGTSAEWLTREFFDGCERCGTPEEVYAAVEKALLAPYEAEEERRRQEEAKRQEEERRAEEERKRQEEARRAEEERRRQEEARLAEEKRRQEEAKRQEEERKRQEEERRAEEKRKQEAARQAEIDRRAEEKRKRKEERQAAKAEKKQDSEERLEAAACRASRFAIAIIILLPAGMLFLCIYPYFNVIAYPSVNFWIYYGVLAAEVLLGIISLFLLIPICLYNCLYHRDDYLGFFNAIVLAPIAGVAVLCALIGWFSGSMSAWMWVYFAVVLFGGGIGVGYVVLDGDENTGVPGIAAVLGTYCLGICLCFGLYVAGNLNDGYNEEQGIYYYIEDGRAEIFVEQYGEELVIPQTIDGYRVSAVRRPIYSGGNVGLEHVEGLELLSKIGPEAFAHCAFTEISIPANIKEIGDGAFRGCRFLETADIADGVQEIGTNAFQDCSVLERIWIPGSVDEMGNEVFAGCTHLLVFCEAYERPDGWAHGLFGDDEWVGNVKATYWDYSREQYLQNGRQEE